MPDIAELIAEALAEYDAHAGFLGTCGDGGCIVKRPQGMHTNGGCRCSTDRRRAQRMMMAGQRLSEKIRAALKARTEGGLS